jgi:predicted CoA-binding protein
VPVLGANVQQRALNHVHCDTHDRLASYDCSMSSATDDERLIEIYRGARTIAVVGASSNPDKPAHRIPAYLQTKGYRIVPVNPNGGELFGEHVVPSLLVVDEPIDVVDVFRPSDEAPAIARDAVAAGAKVLWLQAGIVSNEAAAIATAGGLEVVTDTCMGATHRRLADRI